MIIRLANGLFITIFKKFDKVFAYHTKKPRCLSEATKWADKVKESTQEFTDREAHNHFLFKRFTPYNEASDVLEEINQKYVIESGSIYKKSGFVTRIINKFRGGNHASDI